MTNSYQISDSIIHQDRRLSMSKSKWVSQFGCEHIRPLIICRGPIRKEAMDVFSEMGIQHYGILLSEKDSITYRDALAPELRSLTDPSRVHRVRDYTGRDKIERLELIQQIIHISREHGYNALFSGYGFMAEDAEMVSAMEKAGLIIIGPSSSVIRQAGFKDEAKRTALKTNVSVTPGIDNASSLALLKKYPSRDSLKKLCNDFRLGINVKHFSSENLSLEELSEIVLSASYDKGVDLFSIEDLGDSVKLCIESLAREYPNDDIRLKAIGGGGGKGQRILAGKDSSRAGELVREILQEVKATGVGDNKNIIVELNVKITRHQEIQVIGNGDWCMTLGGRDCSLQMHEQKLLEISVIDEALENQIKEMKSQGLTKESKALDSELAVLREMESEAARFGSAVGLDSVSTFECIVSNDKHFFMEMNTRIQVEHRVSELCYGLEFTNPKNLSDSFVCNSLVELMVLLAAHGKNLPKPKRVLRFSASIEARLNATNSALRPHAGGTIEYWSNPLPSEIRDDQGISQTNPDTGAYMRYHLAGAYDSNIALLLTVGDSRKAAFQNIAEILRRTQLRGKNLSTNLQFHYGLVNWLLSHNVNAQPTTAFIGAYLTAVGELQFDLNLIDLDYAWNKIYSNEVANESDAERQSLSEIFLEKHVLLRRPLNLLMCDPHMLCGWLSLNRDSFTIIDGKISWNENPIDLLRRTYHFLNMDFSCSEPAADVIWQNDQNFLEMATSFYDELNQKMSYPCWVELITCLSSDDRPKVIKSARLWNSIRSAHKGFQSGMDVLGMLIAMGEHSGFFKLKVQPDLKISIPKKFTEAARQEAMNNVLAPPPRASSNELIAPTGGMFYSRESPDHEPLIKPGDHFEQGDPLYIIEVMKMFNKVYADFSGTVEEALVDQDGVIVSRGQPLFNIKPDFIPKQISDEDITRSRKSFTDKLLQYLL